MLEIRQVLWPHAQEAPDPAVEVRTWAMMLERFDVETVLAALQAKAGEQYPPTVGQVKEAIEPTPTYSDALSEFGEMLHAGYGMNRWRGAPWSHPLIAAFAERHFVEWCMSPDGTYDSQAAAEAAARAHFREAFKAVAQRYAAGAIGAGTAARDRLAAGQQIEEASDASGSRAVSVRRGDSVGPAREDG